MAPNNVSGLRLITRLDSLGNETEIAYVKVTATCGEGSDMRSIQCQIDSITGQITNLPNSALWGGLKTAEDVSDHRNKLVRKFHLEVGHAVDARIVVAQRAGKSNKYRPAGAETKLGPELIAHYLPPCGVDFWTRSREEREKHGVGPLAVWTNPMNIERGGCNRIDFWLVYKDGSIVLICVYLVTLDDGATWGVKQQERWTGRAYRRKPNTKHVLQSTDDRVAEVFHGNGAVRDMLNRFVFVPGEHSENIEKRMQILGNENFRKLVESANTTVWDGPEDFWLEREPGTELRDNQGVVQFLTYGVGRASFGIVKLKQPINVGGKMRDVLQFEHTAVQGDLTDEQGILFLASGTIADLDLDTVVSMDKNKRDYPPKIGKLTPRMVPVPIESKTAAA